MQLAISLAVVLVALSVVTDSTEVTEPTISRKFERFQEEVQTFLDEVGEKAKGAFRDLHNSEIVNKTRNWFRENFQKLKEKLKTTFSTEERD